MWLVFSLWSWSIWFGNLRHITTKHANGNGWSKRGNHQLIGEHKLLEETRFCYLSVWLSDPFLNWAQLTRLPHFLIANRITLKQWTLDSANLWTKQAWPIHCSRYNCQEKPTARKPWFKEEYVALIHLSSCSFRWTFARALGPDALTLRVSSLGGEVIESGIGQTFSHHQDWVLSAALMELSGIFHSKMASWESLCWRIRNWRMWDWNTPPPPVELTLFCSSDSKLICD